MNQLSTEVKSHILTTYENKEYFITDKQYKNVMQLSGDQSIKGMKIENDYVSFGNIKSIREIKYDKSTILDSFIERIKGAPKVAYEDMLRGLDKSIKESPGTYKLAKPGTLELRKKIVKKIESYI